MNQTTTPAWSPMVSGPEDDFARYLEFGDLQFDFPDFNVTAHDGGGLQPDGAGTFDTNMEGTSRTLELQDGHQPQSTSVQAIESLNGSNESIASIDIQMEMFQQHQRQMQQQQQQYQRHNIIPPTPTSIETDRGKAQYYQHLDPQMQAMYERYSHHPKDQMNFTPLVSPAVTPLDTQFQMTEFTMPREYFSPLTSPALEAQNSARQSGLSALRSSHTPDMISPIDMNIDLSATPSIPYSNTRKTRRKTDPPPKNPSRAVRQSQAMKQSSRRNKGSTSIPPKEVSEIIEDARKSKPNGSYPRQSPYSQDSSEAESASPESLSETLMPPPATPRPGSAGRSPNLTAKLAGTPSALLPATGHEPATPRSLMKIREPTGKISNRQLATSSLKDQVSLAAADMEQIMEDIALPEPTFMKPSLPPINTNHTKDDDPTTPTVSAHKTPNFGTPSASAPTTANTSVHPSPHFPAAGSPNGDAVSKRTESKKPIRGSKKRNSTSSVQVSPALRPKISPSIKPLLPEGATVSSETSALLLASKSNYQNILEGTHLPGVSYPEALSTNLTSKRTSHKIAEQGRRNRINNALQEISLLLPNEVSNGQRERSGASSSGEAKMTNNLMQGTAAQQSNSKASIVESAIEYIKLLKQELKDVKGKLEVMEKTLAKGPGVEISSPSG